MTIYRKYEELIKTHSLQILDNPEWCKAFFRKAGMTEKDLNIRLFLILLEENIPLEIRKIARSKKDFIDYEIAIKIYTKIFDNLFMPNEIEEILINHIIEIIKVFIRCNVISNEYKSIFADKDITVDLEEAVTKMLENYGTKILEQPGNVDACLKDISKNGISDYERKGFVIFISALNTKNVMISETKEKNLYFIRILRNALSSNGLTYKPLMRNDEMQKEKKKENEKHGIFRFRINRNKYRIIN